VQRKKENPRDMHMRVPRIQRKKKKKKKKEKPQKHTYACPEGAKKMVGGQKCVVGAENTCWESRQGSWVLKNRAGGRKMLLGAQNTQLGLKICGWVVETGS
jgi:hypothetical protein